jgi:hypothetical protein
LLLELEGHHLLLVAAALSTETQATLASRLALITLDPPLLASTTAFGWSQVDHCLFRWDWKKEEKEDVGLPGKVWFAFFVTCDLGKNRRER